MNVFDLLEKDHEAAKRLLARLEATTERATKTREEGFAQLRTALDMHARLEERFFYPELKEAAATRDMTLEALEEHRIVKRLLSEIDGTATDSDEWSAKLKVLKDNVEHHIEEEEGALFPKARKVLGAEEADRIGTEMEAARESPIVLAVSAVSDTAERLVERAGRVIEKARSLLSG